ncbi:MAG TPA: HEAT repeat domain-containing protein [Candidatus Thermoplasmatota archaeon]|nr:HEAT repeat domain-containing protein [Candidatus Thermoplasmatota archaeon]
MSRAAEDLRAPRPPVSAAGTVDPAPAAPETDVRALRDRLLDVSRPMFDRFQAIFALRNLGTDEAAVALGAGMVRDASALLRHECAYVLGQMQREAAIPFLVQAARFDANPMVRHEACEALGAIGTDEVLSVLREIGRTDAAVEVRESCEVALAHIAYLRDPARF